MYRDVRRFGHVVRMDYINWVSRCKEIIVADNCGRGSPRKTCDGVVHSDLVAKDIQPIFGQDRVRW